MSYNKKQIGFFEKIPHTLGCRIPIDSAILK